MPTVTGKAGVRQYIASIPEAFEKKILPGAARAGGKIIQDEAKSRVTSDEVRGAIVQRVRREPGLVSVRITVRPGWTMARATWLEYGTAPHFIAVDESQRQGMSVGRINTLQQAGSLVIGGKFVGKTIWHPGARPNPFLRPALDAKEAEAVAAAQTYVTTRVARLGLGGADGEEGRE